MTAPLYPWPANLTDFMQFTNYTTSNVCADVSNPATCGSYIFFDSVLLIMFFIFFTAFKTKASFKDSYAASSTIIMFLGIILFLLQSYGYFFVRSTELLILIANEFISVLMLYLIKN